MKTDVQTISDMGQLAQLAYRTFGLAILKNQEYKGNFTLEGEGFSLNTAYRVIEYADTPLCQNSCRL